MRGPIVLRARREPPEPPEQLPLRPSTVDGFAFDRLYYNPNLLSFGYEYSIDNEAGEKLLIVRKRPLSLVLHSEVFPDDLGSQCLLTVRQDSFWQIVVTTYTVYDHAGQPIAQVRREPDLNVGSWYGPGVWFAHFVMTDAALNVVAEAHPEGDLLGWNWVISSPTSGMLGQWTRRLSLTDKHTLDLSADIQRSFDRRLAVALGVLLDFASRRR